MAFYTGTSAHGNSGQFALSTGYSYNKGRGGDIRHIVGTGDSGEGGDVIVTAGEATALSHAGGMVEISGGHGSSNDADGGDGGAVKIYGGQASGGSPELDDGGSMLMQGGIAAFGTGGSITFRTGLGAATSSGTVALVTANAGAIGYSGKMTLMTGTTSVGNSGKFTVYTGTANLGTGGSITMYVGDGNSAVGGDVFVQAGNNYGKPPPERAALRPQPLKCPVSEPFIITTPPRRRRLHPIRRLDSSSLWVRNGYV